MTVLRSLQWGEASGLLGGVALLLGSPHVRAWVVGPWEPLPCVRAFGGKA